MSRTAATANTVGVRREHNDGERDAAANLPFEVWRSGDEMGKHEREMLVIIQPRRLMGRLGDLPNATVNKAKANKQEGLRVCVCMCVCVCVSLSLSVLFEKGKRRERGTSV